MIQGSVDEQDRSSKTHFDLTVIVLQYLSQQFPVDGDVGVFPRQGRVSLRRNETVLAVHSPTLGVPRRRPRT